MVKTQLIFCFTDRVQITLITNLPQNYKLSSTCLTDTQVRVLSKGLKFTPTPRRNIIEIQKCIHIFTRKLRLTEHFANENDITFDEEIETQVKNKGTFHPPLELDLIFLAIN